MSSSQYPSEFNQNAIFGPMLATIGLTFIVWIYMYIRRLRLIISSKVNPNDLTPSMLAQMSPPSVSNPSDNLKNLFEIPVIFYAMAVYLFVTHQVDSFYVTCSWIFVVFRCLHSLVHCTFNLVNLRFAVYIISTLSLMVMFVRALIVYLA
ncbi:hypothetical protein C9374_005660 [Naegleria lovaniensis]|uniref:Uncharacterized protein n=1 Tax=Naegleria lovaniensis TaxID=51637 RepID=A0AA88GPM8_NAELO|nr:uncharacterized protein C9374_005660 [Naegleria lovaniensis]KAG2381868.1 hypothetical protein C9374_005660 [Naegleria lovaniensis]